MDLFAYLWQCKQKGESMKLAIIYDSQSGNTKQAAEWIAEGMQQVEGVEAMCFHIDLVDADFIKFAKGVVIGSPSYGALMTADMRNWILRNAGKLELAGKLGGAFATEQYAHGGGEMVVQSILVSELVQGMLCYSSGRAEGHPIIHMGPIGVNDNVEKHNGLQHYEEYFRVYGQRFAAKAVELWG